MISPLAGFEHDLRITTDSPYWASLPAAQQPEWADHDAYADVRRTLLTAPPLVTPAEVWDARDVARAVAAGSALLLQVGDCVENLAECGAEHTAAKLAVLDRLADHLTARASRPTVRVARIAGQFAKPRSQPTEQVGMTQLPVFRGHMINSEQPTAAARRHDPRRMLLAYEMSDKILSRLRSRRDVRQLETGGRQPRALLGPWASHEALVLDYESAQLRLDPGSGLHYLASTHFPWIGDRTRQLDGVHVRLLARTGNPLGCKIGPGIEPAEVARLCETLNPGREPGRLTLIVRLGREHVTELLPPIVEHVAAAGHPVIWLSDPMHGNTIRTASGLKTRRLDDLVTEVTEFRRILTRYGESPGGLHLEVAADDVTECLGGPVSGADDLPARYTTLCDPRLNPEQALTVVEAFL